MKKKFLSILIILNIILIEFMPIVFATNTIGENSNTSNEIIQNVIQDSNTNTQSDDNNGLTENSKEDDSKKIENISTEYEETKEIDKVKSEKETQDKSDNNIEVENNLDLQSEEINEEFSVSFSVSNNKIKPYLKNDIYYLFIPKSVNLAQLEIDYTGNIQAIDNANFDETNKKITGEFLNGSTFIITLNDGQTKTIKIMQSDVPAIYINNLTLKDDQSNIQKTIQDVNSGSKSLKYNAALTVTGCDDSKNNISQEIEFKGRGNTSWKMPKRSYQIKLSKKVNFLGIGESKEKKWVLIANYQDPTLLKNKIMNDICVNSGLSKCPNSSYADLYVDGEYIGNYLVCDKVEIKENRVSLNDNKGVLIELDNAYYSEEDYWFTSNRGNHYIVKEAVADGNDATIKSAMRSFKSALDTFENELYSPNASWAKLSKMIDVESFAKYYLINEFAENTDSYYSSCYFYKDGDSDVIHMGPTWDYDAALGYNSEKKERGGSPNVDYTLNYAFSNHMQQLYKFPQFAKLVNEIYEKNVKLALDKIDVNEMSKTFEKSAIINSIVWSNENTYVNNKNKLNIFVEGRKSYYATRYSNRQIEYCTHVQNVGWMQSTNSGISGTQGQSLRLEGLRVAVCSGDEENISVSYQTHIQDIGWQGWVSNGELSGTIGQCLRLEAVRLKLNNSSKYSIKYRVHVQNIGWTDWAYDGEIAGTEGQSLRLEAIEIQIVEKRNNFGNIIKKDTALINYKGHIQDVGDTFYASDGEVIGTIGRGLRLEGVKIELEKTLQNTLWLEIDEHIQNIGWVKGLTDKEYIGTKGQALRIEALSFKLNGENAENYTIKYRVHVQNIGWQDWKKDGEIAGTTGQSLRIEAIQIKLEEK